MAAEPAYVSRVKIERLGGPQRLAYLPAEDEPVAFGVHSEVAELLLTVSSGTAV